TILSLTVSLIAVLIPLLFMGDVVGRLFREFAVTLSVAILVSAVVSLTLTPMMSARLLRSASEQGRFYRASDRFFKAAIARYGTTLRRVLEHQTATLLVAVATLAGTILLYVFVPKGFFPVQDTGVILGVSEAPPTVSSDADELDSWAPHLLEKLRALPELRDTASDQQNGGLEVSLAIDRDTASRLGITPQAIDDTLYDAFGQRQVSTIFTQLNQYHVVLEVKPSFQGTAQAFQASLTNEPLLILAALVTVYIVLGVLYESYIHPLTILSTLPSAGVGAILALLLCRTDLNVIALIGIILLIGIVKKN